MKTRVRIKSFARRVFVALVLLGTGAAVMLAQQPTHYPEGGEPVKWTAGNILLYIGGPLIILLLVLNQRKREKKKKESK